MYLRRESAINSWHSRPDGGRTSEAVDDASLPLVVGDAAGALLLEPLELRLLGNAALELHDVGRRLDGAGDPLNALQLHWSGCTEDRGRKNRERGGDDGEELHGGDHGAGSSRGDW